ncbi:hypothetical protein LIER_37421 [Lithospermum erythrorhizon]|uniref:Integrase catalytic domain-containing protein n=1 Tax=Lithospermum erythrorhizon TaxID=34254 RepID=A0AAV3PM65_LITER
MSQEHKMKEANRLFQLATTYYDELPKEVYIELRDHPIYEEKVLSIVLEELEDWRTPIAKYLAMGRFSSDKVDVKKMQSRTYKFHMQSRSYKFHMQSRSYKVRYCSVYPLRTFQRSCLKYISHIGETEQHTSKTSYYPNAVISPIPFAMWGIDLVGKLPKKKGGVEYDVVVVDHFSKWVETAPLKKTKGDNIFEDSILAEFCEKYGIERRFSPVYYLQANGQVKENIQRMREHLNFTDELRDKALFKMVRYKHLMARSYNRRVNNRQFRVGDLVVRIVVGPAIYELSQVNGKPINHTWGATKLRKYYV